MFRLLRYQTVKHNFFSTQSFEFVNDADLSNGPYVTLLIGPNGTGKSQLLESLIKIFISVSSANFNSKRTIKFEDDFVLEYQIHGIHVQISSVGQLGSFTVNDQPVFAADVPIPEKVLASAINLNDRFPFVTSKSDYRGDDTYEYLGIRTASNNAFKNYNVLIDRFTRSLANAENMARYMDIFSLLGLAPAVSVLYKAGRNLSKTKYETGFQYLFSPRLLKQTFERILETIGASGRFSIRRGKYERIISSEENLSIICHFFKRHEQILFAPLKHIHYQSYAGLDAQAAIRDFIEDALALRLIRDLELLEVDRLILYRNNSQYAFEQASSGEYHILSGFINIISTIQSNSLIFIDEPEISLHPNWQIKYMDLLQKTFADYADCHFVISTHSHFLVSDLREDRSSVISLITDEKGNVSNQTLEYDTFGWSAENVLYRVFGVGTLRNHYLEMDLRSLLSMVSTGSNEYAKMRDILGSLQRFKITPDDPLLKIIETADQYLIKNGH